MEYDRVSLEDWQKQQPLSVLQLDTADRVVLRVAGKMLLHLHFHEKIFTTPLKSLGVPLSVGKWLMLY